MPLIGNANKSGEYYITDLVGLALERGYKVKGIVCGNNTALLGVNSPLELAQAEAMLQKSVNASLLSSGVLLHASETVRISPFAEIEPGADITGPCEITGHTRVCADARIMTNCVVRDSLVESGAEIRPFSHLENAIVRSEALVGP